MIHQLISYTVWLRYDVSVSVNDSSLYTVMQIHLAYK